MMLVWDGDNDYLPVHVRPSLASHGQAWSLAAVSCSSDGDTRFLASSLLALHFHAEKLNCAVLLMWLWLSMLVWLSKQVEL